MVLKSMYFPLFAVFLITGCNRCSEEAENVGASNTDIARSAIKLNSPMTKSANSLQKTERSSEARPEDSNNDYLFSFVVLGDSRLASGCCSLLTPKFPKDFVKDFAQKIAKLTPKPMFVVFVGDMCTFPASAWLPKCLSCSPYVNHLESWFDTFYAPLAEQGILLYPVMGNHETYESWYDIKKPGTWQEAQARISLDTFKKHLAKQTPEFKPRLDEFDGSYYWDWPGSRTEDSAANSRFIVLNWYVDGKDISPSTIDKVASFIDSANEDNIKNIFIFGHVPLWEIGGENQNRLVHLYLDNNVRAYFGGHVHLYQHNIFSKKEMHESRIRTLHQIVSGAAGAEISEISWMATYKNDNANPIKQSIASYALRYNYVLVEVYEQEIWIKSYVTIEDLSHVGPYKDGDSKVTFVSDCASGGASRKKVPSLIEFERFRVMRRGENVDESEDVPDQYYCGLPVSRQNTKKGSTWDYATSVTGCAHFNPPAEPPYYCKDNKDCLNNTCARETAAKNAPFVCCPSGKREMYSAYWYCQGMPNGSKCRSNAMCESNWCDHGTCSPKKEAGITCKKNKDCLNNTCARETAAKNAPFVCCPSGKREMYSAYWYCQGMPNGSKCRSNAMCANHKCEKGYCR